MMSKTHLTIGIASSLAIVNPTTLTGCAMSVIVGSVGGVLADNDILDNDYHSDALIGQLLAFGISAFTLVIDYFFKLGICNYVVNHKTMSIIAGIVFCITYFVGFMSNHRTFTHSFLALGIYATSIYIVYPTALIGFSVAYFSHLLLDLLNKKKIPLLYPIKGGICLKLCYANKMGNKVFMYGGLGLSIILLIKGILLST